MNTITIRPAQSYDTHALQAISSGEGGSSYPAFHVASHKFFIAENDSQIVGFICAYPAIERQTQYVRLLEPYVYARYQGQGIEDHLKAAALEWAEQGMGIHFFKEDELTLHIITPHEYISSLKYNAMHSPSDISSDTNKTTVPQPLPALI